MPRDEYQRRLDRLRADVCEMADLVLERYELALEARETGDEELTERVRDGDHDVNRRYLDVERDCIDLLALEQPVAGDLRFVASSFKIATDVERIGDLATNLAGYATAADPRAPDDPVAEALDLRSLADDAGEMVADAMAAYEAEDPEAARAVAARDDDLDAACAAASDRVVRTLLGADLEEAIRQERPDDPGRGADGDAEPAAIDVADAGGSAVVGDERDPADALVAAASRALLTIRDVERVGDHAVNVCARTVYAVDADEDLLY